jgi:hypothetical protein
VFDERNKFAYRNFLRFKMYFKLKTSEASMFQFEGNLMEFLLGTSILDETWTGDFCLHLDTNSTHEEEFEVQIRNFLTWS